MFCSNCGNKMESPAKFCENCGAPLTAPPAPAADTPPAPAAKKPPRRRKAPAAAPPAEAPGEDRKVTPNITLGADGKYRWTYEMGMFRNPTIFVLLWKVLFTAFCICFLFVMCLEGCEGRLDAGHLAFDVKVFGIGLAGMTVLAALGYLVFAAIMGGKYIVDFEMDEQGVLHAQAPAQAKKARKLAAATVLAGAASGRLSTAAVGMNAARTEMYTEFARVKKVKACPRRGVITLAQTLHRNQVYAHSEDFDFVLSHIRAHVPGGGK